MPAVTLPQPGDVFGQRTVIGPVRSTGKGRVVACSCSCGLIADVRLHLLLRHKADRCQKCAMRTHGARYNGVLTPEYIAWANMLDRCRNPNNPKYADYGGRGIAVCARWRTFDAFLEDMGQRPSATHSLDRYPDNNGDYEPANCRWAPLNLQNANRRPRRSGMMIEFNGKQLTVSGWAREIGIPKPTLFARLKKGWSIEDALTTPPYKSPPITVV